MSEKLVSVIVPTYNGEKFIEKTLESIINQDYENLEIVLVDDVSMDNTVEVAQKILEASDRKSQLIRRTVNGHQSAARNTGLDASNGEYVIFFDHDDFAEKNFVSSLYKEIEDKNADLVFCKYSHYVKSEDKNVSLSWFPESPLPLPEDYLKAYSQQKICITPIWNFIFNKQFLSKNKLRFPEDSFLAEDVEFIFKAIALSSRMSFVNDELYHHVIHPAQQTKADIANRNDYKNYNQEVICKWRAARCVLKHTTDAGLRDYFLYQFIAYQIIKRCTLAAKAGDHEYYERMLSALKHKKIRRVLLITGKFIFKEPELFFKALMVLYAPDFYYKLRSKK